MSALLEFHFLRPWWLLALLPCALILLGVGRYLRPAGDWQQVIDSELLPMLSSNTLSRASRLPLILLALGWLLGTIALAGPSWEKLPQPAYQKQDALVILLDLSPSMYATDITPSRLVQAQREIRDILSQRAEGLTALIAYAGDAHVVTPLTDDTETIELLLPTLAPAIMPSIGNQPIAALQLAAELIGQAGGQRTRALFVTDGIPDSDFRKLASLAKKYSIELSILAVGTEDGAPIPLNQGGFLKNSRGEVVVARLNGDALSNWANSIGARYRLSSYSDDDINYLLQESGPREQLAAADDVQSQREFDSWVDAGPWFALCLLPLALLAFRRGWLLSLCVLGLMPSTDSYALSWQDLWQTPQQQGEQALAEGEPERAAQVFEDKAWQGTARYRAGDYPGAAESFAELDTGDGHYNRGNALARAGDLKGALAAYDRALELDPDNADAASNRKQVEDALEQQQAEQQGEEGEQQQDDESQQGDSDQEKQQSGQDGEQQDSGNESDGQDTGENSPGEDESSSSDEQDQEASPDEQGKQSQTGDEESDEQEQEAAAEPTEAESQEPPQGAESSEGREAQRSPEEEERLQQWLRQIPDEPGNLLQRKFDYQYRQQQKRSGGKAVEERY